MRHFSCDHCGKPITAAAGPRMIVRIESYPAPEDDESPDDGGGSDVVEEVARMIQQAEESGESVPAPTTREVAYDLCVPCHRRLMANPLGKGRVAVPRFSGN